MNEGEIRKELDEVGRGLGSEIMQASEGQEINLRKKHPEPGTRVPTIF
jgi:hypothetical protein